jgi:diacylglycerol kinase (ATP)
MRPEAAPDAASPRTAVPRPAGATPDLILLVNAKASRLSRGDDLVGAAARALRSRGARVEQRLTQSLDELRDVIAAADRRVVLLGGDGTVHAVANLPQPAPELALLPAGRANNVARSLGIPTELPEAAALAVEGGARSIDAIEARSDGRRYRAVEGVSVGFHARARVNYRAENSAALGRGLAVGLGALWKFRPLSVVLESDGRRDVVTVGQLFAANLPLYGFGMRVAPSADPGDGLLDLVTIEAPTRRSVVAMIPRVRTGTHVGRPGVGMRRLRSVRVDPGGASPVIADSTDLGSGPVELTVEPGALRMVAP